MTNVRGMGWLLLGIIAGAIVCMAIGRRPDAITANNLVSFASLTVFVMLGRSSRDARHGLKASF
jgi:hypothetical protein